MQLFACMHVHAANRGQPKHPAFPAAGKCRDPDGSWPEAGAIGRDPDGRPCRRRRRRGFRPLARPHECAHVGAGHEPSCGRASSQSGSPAVDGQQVIGASNPGFASPCVWTLGLCARKRGIGAVQRVQHWLPWRRGRNAGRVHGSAAQAGEVLQPERARGGRLREPVVHAKQGAQKPDTGERAVVGVRRQPGT